MSTSAIGENEVGGGLADRSATWQRHLAVLAGLIAVLGAVFFVDIRAAAEVWWIYPAYSHCFLIIPISGWLIWEKRAAIFQEAPACSPSALIGAIPALSLWFVGEFASITEFRQFALVAMAQVLIAAVLGWRIYRKISFACLYLFFLVPTGQYLIPPLQDITAKFVQWGLNLFSIPYFRDGLIFDLINGRYEIAEACAGLRFLVATVALGVLFAHLIFRKKTKIVIFLAACLVVPVIGNGIRALLTVMVANYTSNKVAAGFDHIVYGWVFAVAIIFTILSIGARFRDPEADSEPQQAVPSPDRTRKSRLPTTVAGALVLLSFAPVVKYVTEQMPNSDNQATLNASVALPGWHKQTASDDWRIQFSAGSSEIRDAFIRDSDPIRGAVDLDVQYYVRDRGAPSLLAAHNFAWQNDDWHPIEHRPAIGSAGGKEMPFDETVIAMGNMKRLVWSTYWIDGRFTTSSLMVRLEEFQAGILRRRSAVFAVSTPITSTTADARQRLAAFWAAFGSLPDAASAAHNPPAPTP